MTGLGFDGGSKRHWKDKVSSAGMEEVARSTWDEVPWERSPEPTWGDFQATMRSCPDLHRTAPGGIFPAPGKWRACRTASVSPPRRTQYQGPRMPWSKKGLAAGGDSRVL